MRILAPLGLILILSVAVGFAACGPTAAPEPTLLAEEPAVAPTPIPPTAIAPPAAEEEAPTPTPVPPLHLSSSAFDAGGEIPLPYSCRGANVSPPLAWSGVPEGTQSLALVMDDPDSQPPGFVHWVIYNIPPSASGLPEGVEAEAMLPDGTRQGPNDYALFTQEGQTHPGGAPINRLGYDGPCPPAAHRYVFQLYALDVILDLPAESTMADVLAAMAGHVLGQAELTGVFTP
jgi:Raf kinase inhibitor-like YbhB/YbcL family protein